LSAEQETTLCNWIPEQEACSYAPSHVSTREIAGYMLLITGDTKPLGQKWVSTFRKQNPQI
ncbi:hypothetical protein HOY80DRAFT_867337, partial [Tuber brumale]